MQSQFQITTFHDPQDRRGLYMHLAAQKTQLESKLSEMKRSELSKSQLSQSEIGQSALQSSASDSGAQAPLESSVKRILPEKQFEEFENQEEFEAFASASLAQFESSFIQQEGVLEAPEGEPSGDAFQAASAQEEIENLEEELEAIAQEKEELEQKGVSNWDVVLKIAKEIAVAGGTTLGAVTATATLAYQTGGMGATLVGGAIVLNELKKVICSYLDEKGSNEFLEALKNSIDEMSYLTEKSNHILERSKNHLAHLDEKLKSVDETIEKLEETILEAKGELAEVAHETLEGFKRNRELILKQHKLHHIAKQQAKACLRILTSQQEQIADLEDWCKEKMVNAAVKPEELLAQITSSLNEIKAQSQEAYRNQAIALESIINACEVGHSMYAENEGIYKNYMRLIEMQKIIERQSETISHLNQDLQEIAKDKQSLEGDLQEQKAINEEMSIQQEIAARQLGRVQSEFRGEESIMIGTGAALGGGALMGLAVGGPVGAAVGAIGTFFVAGTKAIGGVHYWRSTKRAAENIRQKLEFENFEAQSLSKAKVTIRAEYGAPTGYISFLTKGVMNFARSYFNPYSMIPEFRSVKAGTVCVLVGDVPLLLPFDKSNINRNQFGAIPLNIQQGLNATLQRMLEEGKISPETILIILNKLASVTLGNSQIVMIDPDSIVFQSLKQICRKACA